MDSENRISDGGDTWSDSSDSSDDSCETVSIDTESFVAVPGPLREGTRAEMRHF